MSFREISAWITFVTVLLAAAVFFGAQATGRFGHGGAPHLLLACVVGLIALQAVLHLVAAWLTPRHARGPRDEREEAIQLRSHRAGYYVLVAGVLAMSVTGHATFDASLLLVHALVALVVSTLSISLTQIVLFRLGR